MGCSAIKTKDKKMYKELNNILWIDPEIDLEENHKNNEDLQSMSDSLNYHSFKKLDEAINHLKFTKFQETSIIINEKIYSEFIKYLKANLAFMYIIPKIIILAKDKNNFIKNNKDYQNDENKFYQDGGIKTNFDEIKKMISLDDSRRIITEIKDRRIIWFRTVLELPADR